MKNSIWTETVYLPEFPSLSGDKKTDVLIIGGGICGILCAYMLKMAGVDYILAEAKTIASGITKNTTAKITSQHGLIYSELIYRYGKEKAYLYLKANNDALKEYERLCDDMDCDFEYRKAYTYSLSDRQKVEEEVKAVNTLGFPAEYTERTELPFKIQGSICFPAQGQFNPLKFIKEIAKNLNIFENTFVEDITSEYVRYKKGRIYAKKIIVATHFPYINRYGGYFLKMYQFRSYVTAFENSPCIKGMYVDEADSGLSFRNYKNTLIIGGGGHRTGKQGGNWKEIRDFAKLYYPEMTVKREWATQDCISLDRIPYIGQYSKKTPYLYVATGFNKWGMTSSMIAAQILRDAVCERKNDFAEVFSPQRNIIVSKLISNGASSVLGLITPTVKRCPHMGCALHWNKYEHSWDCSCHGSRFDKDGKLIDNPSVKDANI